MTREELTTKISSLKWYHPIEVSEGIQTIPEHVYNDSWRLMDQGISSIDFSGKKVLDVGTRDGKYAFIAESKGATVIAIDNNQSLGALLLKEFWNSKVDFQCRSMYSIDPVPTFDIILFFGVLYHLRYPMIGLRKLTQALKPDGLMFIETSIYDTQETIPLLYCPVSEKPYEPTSCSFFNVEGLKVTLNSFGCTVLNHQTQSGDHLPPVKRCWFEVKKTHAPDEQLMAYWEGLHHFYV
jgi:SAM-dependent methyltransferase